MTFLKSGIIHFYSIQIDSNDTNKKVIFLNFRENKKENIIKAFNIVKQRLEENQKSSIFLKEEVLEKRFLAIFYQNFNSNTTITKSSESFVISTKNKSKVLSFFTIDFDFIEKKHTFISNLLNLINNLGEKGSLVLNFKIDDNDVIRISPYFVLESENVDEFSNFENKVNAFFHFNLLKQHRIKIKTLSNFLWRLGIDDSFYFLKDSYDIFELKHTSTSKDLIEINEQFEENLQKNQIEYVRLSKNLLFIEYSFVFILLEDLNCDFIYKVIEKYHSKFIIYILILNEVGLKELHKMKTIKLIDNIKIVNPIELREFNYKQFKRI